APARAAGPPLLRGRHAAGAAAARTGDPRARRPGAGRADGAGGTVRQLRPAPHHRLRAVLPAVVPAAGLAAHGRTGQPPPLPPPLVRPGSAGLPGGGPALRGFGGRRRLGPKLPAPFR